MPAVVRKTIDTHSGHARTSPSAPFHRTNYTEGSDNVLVNGFGVVRIGDGTACTDKAKDGSPRVFANKKAIHRLGDPTTGHDNFLPNFAATGSHNVFADDISLGVTSLATKARTLDDVTEEQAEVVTLQGVGESVDNINEEADTSPDGALFGKAQFGRGSFGGDR